MPSMGYDTSDDGAAAAAAASVDEREKSFFLFILNDENSFEVRITPRNRNSL